MMDLGTGNISVNKSTASASTTTTAAPQQQPNDVSGTKSSSSDVTGASSEAAKNKVPNVTSGGNLPSTTPPPQSKYPSYFHQQQQAYHQQIVQNSNTVPSPGYYSYTTATQDQPQQALPPSPGYVDFDMHARLQNSALYNRSQQYGAGNLPQLPLTPNNSGNSHINSDIGSPNFLCAQRGVFNPVDASQKLDSMNMPSSAGQAPPSPQMPFLNNGGQLQPPTYSAGVYQGGYADMNDRHVPLSPQPNWNHRAMQQQQMYQQALASPQYSGMGGVYATAAGAAASNIHPGRPDIQQRTHSFDETTMLPPSAISSSESLDHYSQYTQTAAGNGSTLFAHHPQQWAGPPPHHGDMFSPGGGGVAGTVVGPLSPVSPRLLPSNKRVGGGGGGAYLPAHQMPYFHQQQQQQHATTTPGPPIQTTNSNKGPDGANLFIFHIPNNFTNLDMYQLFCAFGSLLSVRIMVEKDTGRSRGFGFVSYDSPESAALAIKELNGYVIGNKRLKVQHKQIRSSDHNKSEDSNTPGWYGNPTGDIIGDTEDNAAETNKSSPQDADSNDAEGGSALNHMDSIRNALPETSSG